MTYDILNKLKKDGNLEDTTIAILNDTSRDRRTFIFGRAIQNLDRKGFTYMGGEGGREEFFVPIKQIEEIFLDEEVIFKKRQEIEKILPFK